MTPRETYASAIRERRAALRKLEQTRDILDWGVYRDASERCWIAARVYYGTRKPKSWLN